MTTKYTIEMTREMGQLLDQLVRQQGASSKAEVIRRSIALMTVAQQAKIDGMKLSVTTENGKIEKELILP